MTGSPEPKSRTATPFVSGRQFLRTVWLVALAIAVMFSVDTFLAKMEQNEVRVEAARLFTQGQKLLAQGQYQQAASSLKDALAIERSNYDYQLALARAQFGEGQYEDAEQTLNNLLLADSTLGPANLEMARVLLKEGRVREAISYYHRAVYGEWKSDSEGNRLTVHFELIDLLAQQNSKEELLAELLAVEDQAPTDVATRIRIGQLFLEAGSATRAADVFRQALKQDPDSADAYRGLGEAEFSRGDYRTAIADFSQAVRRNPSDTNSEARINLCNQILTLDPTRRGLDQEERLRRSRALLQMTLDAALPCFGTTPSPSSADLLDSARKSLQARAVPNRRDESAEASLDLAEKLWQARNAACSAPSANDPLALVMARAAR